MDEPWDEIEVAPAKINLALHVTGQRHDGFHTLESLVTFADRGDVIRLRSSPADKFSIGGRFATVLDQEGAADDNLVTRARDVLRDRIGDRFDAPPVHIHLEKNLPIASGIGGGSADAAATLRALMRHWEVDPEEINLEPLCLSLGADVPMCLASRPLLAAGVGEKISPVDTLPSFHMILVNPLIGVSTPEIFRALKVRTNSPLPALPLGETSQRGWMQFLLTLRNDLEQPAIEIVPDIGEAMKLLKNAGASLVRMSGSGATCFGLFESAAEADAAFAILEALRPDWYLLRTETVQGGKRDARH